MKLHEFPFLKFCMANPDWAINLLERSETVVDFFRRGALKSSSSISNLGDVLRLSVSGTPVPQGQMYHSMKHCVVSNFVEGFAIGGGMSVIVSVIPSLLKGNVRRAAGAVATFGNVRVALFFGSLMSICNTGMYFEREAGGSSTLRSRRRRMATRLLIGLLSGLSVSVLPKGIRRFIVYFLFTRSLEVLARLIRSKRSRAISDDNDADTIVSGEDNTFSAHEVVGLASGSMAVIITAWFRFTHLVPKGYLTFLQGINNLTHVQVDGVQRAVKNDCQGFPHIQRVVDREVRMCSLIHPEAQTCTDFFTNFIIKGLLTRSGPFYLKLYSLPFIYSLIFANKTKSAASLSLATHFIARIWWSSLFLAVLNASAAGTVCLVSKVEPIATSTIVPLTLHASLGGAVSGLALYLEQKSRRLELSLYLFGQAIQILLAAYAASGWWYPRRGLDILVTASSISLITFAYWHQEEQECRQHQIIRPGYSALIHKIIDTTENRHTFIWK